MPPMPPPPAGMAGRLLLRHFADHSLGGDQEARDGRRALQRLRHQRPSLDLLLPMTAENMGSRRELTSRRAQRYRCLLNQMPATKRNTDAARGKSRGTRSRYVQTSKSPVCTEN
jgi:hypothetical protein